MSLIVQWIRKIIRLRGIFSAATRVKKGEYLVTLGNKKYPAMMVFEPHVNSPVAQRVLVITCKPHQNDFDEQLRRGVKSGACQLVLSRQDGSEEAIALRELTVEVSSVHTYTTIGGNFDGPALDSTVTCSVTVNGNVVGRLEVAEASNGLPERELLLLDPSPAEDTIGDALTTGKECVVSCP